MSTRATKILLGISIVASTAFVGSGTLATAKKDDKPDKGYAKEQCKKGGWEDFKNPDGSPMFKNQGDCIKFFTADKKHHHKDKPDKDKPDKDNDDE